MNPSPTSPSPPPAAALAAIMRASLSGPPGGAAAANPVNAQFDGVANKAEAPKSPRSGALANLQSGIRHLFTGAANREHAPANRPEIVVVKSADTRELSTMAPEGDLTIVSVVIDKLAKASTELMPLVRAKSDLTPDQLKTFSNTFRDVGIAIGKLGMPLQDKSGPEGQTRWLMNVPDDMAMQIQTLRTSILSHQKSAENVWLTPKSRESVLDHFLGPQDVIRFLGEARHAVKAYAQQTGDQALIEKADGLFPDPLTRELKETLGTTESEKGKQGEYGKLMKEQHYKIPDKNHHGQRYGNIPFNTRTEMKLSDGEKYLAHRMKMKDGSDIGIATGYPKSEHLPHYLRMLVENKVEHLVVLASSNEIETRRLALPAYFNHSGSHGEYRVDTSKGAVKDFGPLKVREHTMTISSPGMTPRTVVAHHVENWPDQTTVPADAVLDIASDLQKRGARGDNIAVHCKAGVGRTGLFLAGFAMNADPMREAMDVVRAQREARSPWMVQTAAQLETVGEIQREVEARTGTAEALYADQASFANRASQMWPDWTAPHDGDGPIYENVPRQPVYENAAAFRR